MENDIAKPRGSVLKQLSLLLMMVTAIYLADGLTGLAPFMNLEAILLVFGGSFLLTWTAFPITEIFRPTGPRALRHAAGCAIGMGVLATLLNLMPLMWVGNEPELIIKHAGAALAGLFYGFLLAKVILAPIVARLEQ